MNKIHLALWIAAIIAALIISVPCSFAQLIDVGRPPSQESYQLGINKASLGAQYSEYYAMLGGPAPAYHVSFPAQFDITGNMPSSVYYSRQQQPVPFSQYQSAPTYNMSNSLWIQGRTSWAQYVAVPRGSTVSLIAVSPTGGSGNLVLADASGQVSNYNYYFYPYSQLTFYADRPGRNTLSFSTVGMTSNTVVIDVTGVYTPPNGYQGTYQSVQA